MLRFIAFTLTMTASLSACFLTSCNAADPINTSPPGTVSNQMYAWTYRTGIAANRLAVAFHINGSIGTGLQGNLCMYRIELDGEGGEEFKKKKIKIVNGSSTLLDVSTVPCVLVPDPKKGYVINVDNAGTPYPIGSVSITPDKQYALVRWNKDTVKVEDVPIMHNPCDEPPEIGEEELISTRSNSPTVPSSTLVVTPGPRPRILIVDGGLTPVTASPD
jgi:hypothetical protein